MYSINDRVLYGAEGVCIVEDIAERDLSGEKIKYYVLRPVYKNTMTVYVPLNNQKLLMKMHKLMTVEEIHELIKSIPEQKDILIKEGFQCHEKYREIIASGDRNLLIRLICTLYKKKMKQENQKKRLGKTDEMYLSEAEKVLHNEIAFVLQIEPDQVMHFISRQLDGYSI